MATSQVFLREADYKGLGRAVRLSDRLFVTANPSKRDSAAKKVVAVSRAIVTYQIDLPAGCVRMQRTLFWLAPYEETLPTIFDEYLKKVTRLPITSERLFWDRKGLAKVDKLLEAANRSFRDRIFDASWALIDRFADLAAATKIERIPE